MAPHRRAFFLVVAFFLYVLQFLCSSCRIPVCAKMKIKKRSVCVDSPKSSEMQNTGYLCDFSARHCIFGVVVLFGRTAG